MDNGESHGRQESAYSKPSNPDSAQASGRAIRRAGGPNALFTTPDQFAGERRLPADPSRFNLAAIMQATQHPSSVTNSDSTSGGETPRNSNILPLRRAAGIAPEPDRAPELPSGDSLPARPSPDPDEPAWRRAFVAPDGVRFTRTPDRNMRERNAQESAPKHGAQHVPS